MLYSASRVQALQAAGGRLVRVRVRVRGRVRVRVRARVRARARAPSGVASSAPPV